MLFDQTIQDKMQIFKESPQPQTLQKPAMKEMQGLIFFPVELLS